MAGVVGSELLTDPPQEVSSSHVTWPGKTMFVYFYHCKSGGHGTWRSAEALEGGGLLMLKRLTLNPESQSLGHWGKHIPKSSHISGLRGVQPGLCRYIRSSDLLMNGLNKTNVYVCNGKPKVVILWAKVNEDHVDVEKHSVFNESSGYLSHW